MALGRVVFLLFCFEKDRGTAGGLTQVEELLQQQLLLQQEEFRGSLWVYNFVSAVSTENGFVIGGSRYQGEGQNDQADGLRACV